MTWAATAASAKGSSHDAETPNQDAFRVLEVRLPAGGVAVVAAVADGHGGRRYVRSDTGAAFAVRLAVDMVAASLTTGGPSPALLRQLVPQVVALWRGTVLRHAADHPFTATEAARAGDGLAFEPLIAYGSTLLVVVVQGAEIALAQIGDGDVLVHTASGAVVSPVPTDDRLVASETTSLCVSGAEGDFRYAFVGSEVGAGLVLMATDGYGNSFGSGQWRQEVGADLAELAAGDAGWANVQAGLPGWLAESALVGGDDVTAVLLVDRAGHPPLPVAPFPAPPAKPPPAVSPVRQA